MILATSDHMLGFFMMSATSVGIGVTLALSVYHNHKLDNKIRQLEGENEILKFNNSRLNVEVSSLHVALMSEFIKENVPLVVQQEVRPARRIRDNTTSKD